VPRQARSQVTVGAIVDATGRVLVRHGYAGCTTKRVAEVAGVGIGSLYEYFPNKDALVAAVVEQEVERFMGVLERELTATLGRPFAGALRTALGAALRELESRRALLSVLVIEYPRIVQLATLSDLPLRAAEFAAICLRGWGDELGIPDQPATHYVLANMLFGVCLSQTLRPATAVTSEAMLDALVQVLLQGLQGREAAMGAAP